MNELNTISIHKAKRGDQKAFKELYDHYLPFVWNIIYRTAGNDMNAAHDIIQEIFTNVYKALPKFKGNSALSTWIYRIAYNGVAAYYSKQKRFYPVHQSRESQNPHGQTDAYEIKEMVSMVLGSLSAEERFLLTAREVNGLSFEEMAQITGKNEGALRTQLHRLKSDIRRRFSPQFDYSKEAVL